MRLRLGVMGAAGTSAGALAVAVLLLLTLLGLGSPAQGAPTPMSAGTATASGTPTATSTPTASPSPTPTPTPTPMPSVDEDLLLPDVIALKAAQLYIQPRSDGSRLRFSSSLGNMGAGPLEVRPNRNQPCPAGQHNSTQIIYRDANDNRVFNARRDTRVDRHRAGCMVYHPHHAHWHFKASARYTLLEPGVQDRVVVSARRKVSFCLRDSARVPARYGTWDYPLTYGSCERKSPQGISVGWMDIYQNFLAGQSLALPRGLDNGLYCLETVVDPIDQLTESDDTNNSSLRALVIKSGNRVEQRPASRCG